MRRGVLGVRLKMVKALSEADALPRRETGFDVPILRFPGGDVEIDLHLQCDRVPELNHQKEDEGEDPIQLGGLRVDRPDEGLRGLQPAGQARPVHARAERGGEGVDGL